MVFKSDISGLDKARKVVESVLKGLGIEPEKNTTKGVERRYGSHA